MTTSQSSQQQDKYLNILGIFFYIFGGFMAMLIVLVLSMSMFALTDMNEAPPNGMFLAIMITLVSVYTILGVCWILTGRFLRQRRRYVFCLVMSAISCLFAPIGTVGGILTIILLIRPEVKATFQGQPSL